MAFKVGITGTGSLIGQAIIKSIQNSQYRADYELIGFDYFTETVGSYWVKRTHLLPDILSPAISEATWIAALKEKIEEEQLAIVFVGVDFELPILARYRAQLEEETGCHIIVSSEKVIAIGNDKYDTYEFLKENGLAYPVTYLPEERAGKKLEFPLIVKPRVGARSIGVYKVKDAADLEDKLPRVEAPIIQEHLGSIETEYTCGVLWLDNQLQASIILKRSLKGGNTLLAEYSSDFPATIKKYIEDIAIHLKPYGACNLQLRLKEDGTPVLFEINPRHSGTTYMRSLFGYEEVVYILKYLLEGIVLPFELKEGKALRFYEEKLL